MVMDNGGILLSSLGGLQGSTTVIGVSGDERVALSLISPLLKSEFSLKKVTHTLSMISKGQTVRDARQFFSLTKGQGLGSLDKYGTGRLWTLGNSMPRMVNHVFWHPLYSRTIIILVFVK